MWRRWKAGESLHEIGRAFGKGHGSIRFLLTQRGGIVPAARRRSPRTLTLAEREDISGVTSRKGNLCTLTIGGRRIQTSSESEQSKKSPAISEKARLQGKHEEPSISAFSLAESVSQPVRKTMFEGE
jgi:hypothetical protein